MQINMVRIGHLFSDIRAPRADRSVGQVSRKRKKTLLISTKSVTLPPPTTLVKGPWPFSPERKQDRVR